MAAKLMPIIGQVLDHALQHAQISRRDAADRLGVSVADLDAWIHETRAPNAGQFGDLVKLLGCTPSYLFLPAGYGRPHTTDVIISCHCAECDGAEVAITARKVK
jgi:transcriptional regulator with XRE-family HTH domain